MVTNMAKKITKNSNSKGVLYRIAGPVVFAKNLQARMYDVVRVGNEQLMGEVIQIREDVTVIQVYEDTSGIKPGEPVENTGKTLSVELGPGLLTSIYDGIQRPLESIASSLKTFSSQEESSYLASTKTNTGISTQTKTSMLEI